MRTQMLNAILIPSYCNSQTRSRLLSFFPVPAGNPLLQSAPQQKSTYPYYLNKAQPLLTHNGSPVPPRYLIRDHATALGPSVFATDKGMPVASGNHYAGVASSSNTVHAPQTLLASVGNPPEVQNQPGYCSPGEHDS